MKEYAFALADKTPVAVTLPDVGDILTITKVGSYFASGSGNATMNLTFASPDIPGMEITGTFVTFPANGLDKDATHDLKASMGVAKAPKVAKAVVSYRPLTSATIPATATPATLAAKGKPFLVL